VESQEVVPVEARASDRWSMVETTMRTIPVVMVKPGLKLIIAMLGSGVETSVSPFAQSGLDEAFGFAVGARSIGASEAMAQTESKNGAAEGMGAITVAVIGEQTADADAQAGVISQGGMEKSDGRSGGAVGQDLGKGDTGMVVDGDVEALPAGMMFAATATVGTSDDVGKAAQGLEVEMEQIPRSGMFIADQRYSRFEIAQAIEAQATKNAADSGPAATCKAGNVQAGEALAAKLFHLLDLVERSTAR